MQTNHYEHLVSKITNKQAIQTALEQDLHVVPNLCDRHYLFDEM